jgi:hypothetical protein
MLETFPGAERGYCWCNAIVGSISENEQTQKSAILNDTFSLRREGATGGSLFKSAKWSRNIYHLNSSAHYENSSKSSVLSLFTVEFK